MTTGENLRKQGFDSSRYDRSDKSWKVGCSQCQAMVIQGIACHENGCPNSRREK